MPYTAILDDSDEVEEAEEDKEEMRIHFVTRCMKEIDLAVDLDDGVLAQRCVCVLRAFLDGIPRFKGTVTSSLDVTKDCEGVEEIRRGKVSARAVGGAAVPKRVNIGSVHKFRLPSANSDSRVEALESLKVGGACSHIHT